jgi:hypothetical protein
MDRSASRWPTPPGRPTPSCCGPASPSRSGLTRTGLDIEPLTQVRSFAGISKARIVVVLSSTARFGMKLLQALTLN